VAEAVAVDGSMLEWDYHWRKDTLDAVIFVQAADGVAMDYKQAQAFMDRRLEERKKELTTKNTKSAKKEGK
jgi:hypothetical protein